MTILLALAVAAAGAGGAPDYDSPDTWLCRPGRVDACDVDLSATVVAPDGSLQVEAFEEAEAPAFDCFYLYPTVSRDPSLNADLAPGEQEEIFAVQRQVARFGSICRMFAPIYRQVTLRGLLQLAGGGPEVAAAQAMVYDDVKSAWEHYLAHDNDGRGVVLIGHSQGAVALKRLIELEIDGKPTQERVVSAMLLGANVAVPTGQDVGGDFQAMPLCRSNTQTGCIVSYVSFRDDPPPPAEGGYLGLDARDGLSVACTNPAALGGGRAILHSYFPTTERANAAPMGPWTADGAEITTPFVTAPGLVAGECKSRNGRTYLAITVNADPEDPRTDRIGGDASTGPTWGLHLIDVNLAMDDLITLANQQATAWAERHAAEPPASDQ